MKQNYEKPNFKIVLMGGEDIIQTSSGGLTDGGEGGEIDGEGNVSGGGVGIIKAPIGIKLPGKFI